MNISDYIQFSLAVIATIGAIFAFVNIRTSKRQIELQQKQWEHKHIPIFRIVYNKKIDKSKMVFIIENTNAVFHQIKEISFTTPEAIIEKTFFGKLTSKKDEKTDEKQGLTIILKLNTELYNSGFIQIVGLDSLGNKFKSNTVELKFQNNRLINNLDVYMSYLNNI